MELADRETPYFPQNAPRYYSLIPLAEVLGEIFSKGPSTKTVLTEYAKLIRIFDSEFNLMLNSILTCTGRGGKPYPQGAGHKAGRV
jgi:PHP family Zn ribbon phosphoesterase